MDKDIMKNDKAGDDLQSNLLAGDIQNIMLRYSDTYVIEVSDAIARYIKLHYTAKEIKPTTDIDEVRKIFEETFTATNEDTADLYDDIWNFFEPYLKGSK